MRALDLDGIEFVVFDLDVGVLGDLVALDLVLTVDGISCLRRLPVWRLSRLKRTRSEELEAG